MYLQNSHDTEDIFQTIFLKYALSVTAFKSGQHEKAWLLRVSMNCCKDYLKNSWRKKVALTDACVDILQDMKEDYSDVLAAIRTLKPNYRDAVYLHYYEGYTAKEIAKIMGKRENTIYSLLNRARSQLKEVLGGEYSGT